MAELNTELIEKEIELRLGRPCGVMGLRALGVGSRSQKSISSNTAFML